jgi:hypothetical protein
VWWKRALTAVRDNYHLVEPDTLSLVLLTFGRRAMKYFELLFVLLNRSHSTYGTEKFTHTPTEGRRPLVDCDRKPHQLSGDGTHG